jgi:hypothetical protein
MSQVWSLRAWHLRGVVVDLHEGECIEEAMPDAADRSTLGGMIHEAYAPQLLQLAKCCDRAKVLCEWAAIASESDNERETMR